MTLDINYLLSHTFCLTRKIFPKNEKIYIYANLNNDCGCLECAGGVVYDILLSFL